jgi:pSer/pThr/pTyr-binding forkhead associated (FHA) protein
MAATVRLSVLTGPHSGSRYCFRAGCDTTLGRTPGCQIQLAGAERDNLISRRHCQLRLDGPTVHVCDLGSKNGTFINGHKVQPPAADRPANQCKKGSCFALARDGDILTIGGTTVQIHMKECPGHPGGIPDWPDDQIVKCNCPVTCEVHEY